MSINTGIFGDTTSLDHRYIPDHEKLEELVRYWKRLGLKIVLTSGTFDLFHIGHAQYLEKAKELGDLLIVGVDSDAKVKARKGPHRPIVPELERVQIISHCRHADVITIKDVDEPTNHLIKIVSPDVLVVSKSTKHRDDEVDEKAQYCGEIVVLEPQSETSTSAKLRLIQIGHRTKNVGKESLVAIAYIPVVHQGYLRYLKELEKEGVQSLYLVSDEILESHEELDYINRKDRLRALPHEVMKSILQRETEMNIESLTLENILRLQEARSAIVAPREDISTVIMETYFGGHNVTFQDVFLRRNNENLEEEKEPEATSVTVSAFEKEVMGKVLKESEKSADWWRQVGAALVKDGEIVAIAHNEHMPEKELPNIIGDSRSLFKKGTNVDYVTAAHAEVGVLGEAARKGITTEGAELFVTDFPCPYCARLIAKSGIKKIYFLRGYAVLGGDEFFKDMGIEMVKVNVDAVSG